MRFPAALVVIPLVLVAAACRKQNSASVNQASAAPEVPQEVSTADSTALALDELAAAARAGDRERLKRIWSSGALVEEFLGEADEAARSQATAAVEEHFDFLSSYLEKCIGETHTMTGEISSDSGLTLIYARTRQKDGSQECIVRFWFGARDGRVQLVDCEDISLGR